LSFVLALSILSSCSTTPPRTEDLSKAKGKPESGTALSAVLRAVEDSGYNPVVEVEFEKDHWEIKAFKDGQLYQLNVGPKGEIIPNPPPPINKPLSAIIKSLEDQGYGPIVDVERASDAGGSWDVEAYKGKSEVKIVVESATGKITIK
jgi:uncharacterized protein (UPF0297 family)